VVVEGGNTAAGLGDAGDIAEGGVVSVVSLNAGGVDGMGQVAQAVEVVRLNIAKGVGLGLHELMLPCVALTAAVGVDNGLHIAIKVVGGGGGVAPFVDEGGLMAVKVIGHALGVAQAIYHLE